MEQLKPPEFLTRSELPFVADGNASFRELEKSWTYDVATASVWTTRGKAFNGS